MSAEITEITKDNIIDILKDLGKEYRKRSGKTIPAEIVMVGGGVILARYGFRESSSDIDAIIRASSSLKDAAIAIRDKYNLEYNWLNTDFMNTDSYSEKLYQHSRYFRTFSNILAVRTVEPEYLVAMKLRSARPYKHDLSDIAGIITEEKEINPDFTKQGILNAYHDMYRNFPIDDEVEKLMNKAFTTTDPDALIHEIKEFEQNISSLLNDFKIKYPGVLNIHNIKDTGNQIAKNIHEKRVAQAEAKFGTISEETDLQENRTPADE